MPDILIAVLLGVVEGLTEFVPVSSTGHLILAGELVGFAGDRAATFEVVIQLGAILAVAWLFRVRLIGLLDPRQTPGFSGRRGVLLLALTSTPALVVGAAAHGAIKTHLFSPFTVAIGLAAGGLAILVVERRRPAVRRTGLDTLRWQDALAVGLFQCLALWPGVSRAAATIAGGMAIGLNRMTAAEYSFLAAIPIIPAAAVFAIIQGFDALTRAGIPVFAAGFLTAFVVAWLAVAVFLRYLSRATFVPFGWYRLALAAAVFVVLGVDRVWG